MLTIPKTILAVGVCVFAFTANATVYTAGYLTRDTDNSYITDSLNNRTWLGWDITKGYTYAQTLAAIDTGGQFAGYSIAHNADAYKFLSAVAGGQALSSAPGGYVISGQNVYDAENVVGESSLDYRTLYGYFVDYDRAYFLNDEDWRPFGRFDLYAVDSSPTSSSLLAFIASASIQGADGYAHNTGWLLFRDNQESTVTEPSGMMLLGLAVAGLVTTRRKKTI